MILKDLLLILIILLCVIIVCSFVENFSFALLPSFVRQEITDGNINNTTDFWYDLIKGKYIKDKDSYPKLSNFADLSAVSYLSDGKNLNFTLWLSSPFIEKPSHFIPSYGMLIDIDSSKSTGHGGYDYMLQVIWNNETKNWIYDLEEWSSVKGAARIILEKENYTHFFGKRVDSNTLDGDNNRYINLALDSTEVGYTNNAIGIFFVEYEFKSDGKNYKIADFSNWVPIPPPKFILSLSPDSVNLRPQDQQTVRIQIQSNTSLVPQININTGQAKNIAIRNLTNSKLQVPPYGMSSSYLSINYLRNSIALPSDKLPVTATIILPNLERGSPSNNKEIILNGSITTEQSYLTLSFLPPYSILDYLDIMKNSIVSPIGGLVALVSSIIVGGLNIRKWFLNRHRKEEERHKTQNNNWGIG